MRQRTIEVDEQGLYELLYNQASDEPEFDTELAWLRYAAEEAANTAEEMMAKMGVYLNAVPFNDRGLPDPHPDFGPKRITVEIFFEPTAVNHPGDGSGEIPNWFHYWGQRSAGRGFDPFYRQEIPPCISSEEVLLGRYESDDNKVYLAEALARSTCPARPGAPGSTGIDCYAEIVRHETTHQREQQYWWRVEKNGIDLEPHSCFLGGMNLTAAANFHAAVDSDLDGGFAASGLGPTPAPLRTRVGSWPDSGQPRPGDR